MAELDVVDGAWVLVWGLGDPDSPGLGEVVALAGVDSEGLVEVDVSFGEVDSVGLVVVVVVVVVV